MKKLILLLIAGCALSACSFTRATPAQVVNVTAPKPVSATAPVSTAAATSTAAGVTSATTLNKISNDDDGIVVDTAGTKDMPTSGTMPSATTAAKSKPVAGINPLIDTSAGGVAIASTASGAHLVNIGGVDWQTPVSGKIVTNYTVALKGVDVSGKLGQSIVAAQSGKVVYSGNGLKGYGNLIIIKHTDNYLTAYSHNKLNLVKEGEQVKQGQKIAELGNTESTKPILHFELRKSGKPINPSALFAATAQ